MISNFKLSGRHKLCLLHTAFAMLLCQLPLFNLLAYEFCFATCLCTACSAPWLGYYTARRRPAAQPLWQSLWQLCGDAWLPLLPGLCLVLGNAWRVPNCNVGMGLAFWLLLPVPSALYGTLLGRLSAQLSPPKNRWLGICLCAASSLAPLGALLLNLYMQPAIFVYDHLWGYFAGSLYDETIRIDRRLLWFRFGSVLRLICLTAFSCRLPQHPTRRWLLRSVALGLFLGLLLYQADAWLGQHAGYRSDFAQLARLLPQVVQRGPLLIHLPSGTSPALQQAIGDEHAFRLAQIVQMLDLSSADLQRLTPIHSYLFATAAQKAAAMGGAQTMLAKPWLHALFMHQLVAPHPLLAHELVHAVAASFGSRLLQVSAHGELGVNLALTEGLAEALAPDDQAGEPQPNLHVQARVLRDMQLLPDLTTLLSPSAFWQQDAPRAYSTAGSFVRYLLATYGAAPLKNVYADGNFQRAYQRPLSHLVQAWHTFLDQLQITRRDRENVVNRLAQGRSLFARPCAHEVAALQAQARHSAAPAALQLYERLARYQQQTPSARWQLALALQRALLAAPLPSLPSSLATFWQLSTALLQTDPKQAPDARLSHSAQASLWLAQANVAWQQAELRRAQAALAQVFSLEVDYSYERRAWVGLWALQQPPSLQPTLQAFLNAPTPHSLATLLALPNPDKTLAYLIARQHLNNAAATAALPYLSAAAAHPFPPIESERRRLYALALWQTHQWQASQAAWLAYRAAALTPGDVALANDWLARLQWQLDSAP